MNNQRPALTSLSQRLLCWLLPQHDFEHLYGYYERGFLEHQEQLGKKAARRWLFYQILHSSPGLLKLKISGEVNMLKNYIATALRNIQRHKVYSFINIAGLAFGMVCCLVIFLWVKYQWSYDHFHTHADSIHRIVINWPRGSDTNWHWRTPPPLAASLSKDIPEIKEAARFYSVSGLLIEQGQTQFKETIGFTDSPLFSIFTLPILKGATSQVMDDPQALIISESAAEKFFGAQDPLGKILILEKTLSFRVAAVMQDIPTNSLLRCPILVSFVHLEAVRGYGNVEDWGDFGYNTFVQLESEANIDSVNMKLHDYLDKVWEDPENQVVLSLQPLEKIHLHTLGGGGPIVYIWIFSAIAVFILLIACINFMNLATARSMTRAREIGVRKVVGAVRSRLIQQFMIESLLMSLISLVCALVIVGLLEQSLSVLAEIPKNSGIFNLRIFPVFLLITILTGVTAGSYPALFLSSFRPVEVLKGGQKSGSPVFRKILVVFQFSISIFLLIGLLLISQQMDFIRQKPLGFNTSQVVYVPLNEELKQNHEPFRNELLRNAGVKHASLTSSYLGQSPKWSTGSVMWEGKNPEDGYQLSIIYADYDFADTMELELAQGRFFSRTQTSDAANFVLNETAARNMGVDNPLGMQIRVAEQEGFIIGILKDFNFTPLHNDIKNLIVIMEPQYYSYLAIKIQAHTVPSTLEHVEKAFIQFSSKYPFEFHFLDEVLQKEYLAELRSQKLLRYFVGLAGLISCLGLFGLSSFMVEKRTKEIGIRKVLGASESGVFILLSRTFLFWILAANVIAWPLAYFAMSRWLESFAFRTSLLWGNFILAGLISLGVALITVSWQTFRSARSNPVKALKYE
jgi:putative ABC transport system permease protein